MSIIIGLDLSLTSTGIAVLEGDRVANTIPTVRALRSIGFGTVDSKSYIARVRRCVATTHAVIEAVPRRIDLAVIEEMPSHMKAQPSLGDRWILWGGVVAQLDAMGIPVAVVNPATREKWATGKVVRGLDPKDRKARVTNAVRAQWPDLRIRNHDEADALTLASMGALHSGWQLPFPVKPRHHEGLTKVTWPKEQS